jgi:ribulose-5-phosphate 4-epimerase/fuculose-1-phosphate aldolase
VTGGLIKTRSLGVELAETLGDARACLMPQHGLVAVGPDTIAKRAEVWADSQIQAGWEYLVRRGS